MLGFPTFELLENIIFDIEANPQPPLKACRKWCGEADRQDRQSRHQKSTAKPLCQARLIEGHRKNYSVQRQDDPNSYDEQEKCKRGNRQDSFFYARPEKAVGARAWFIQIDWGMGAIGVVKRCCYNCGLELQIGAAWR